MKEYILKIVGHSADLKTSQTKSKDTGIFLPQDLVDFLGANTDYAFTIYKEDCAKAMAAIISALPLYSNKGGKIITHSSVYEETVRLISMISEFFKSEDTALYTGFNLSETTGSRKYLYGLEVDGFSLRKLLVADHSVLKFQKKDNGQVDLRFQTNLLPNNSKEEYADQDIDEDNNSNDISSAYRQYITAIKSKPFLLLAGISGTGKSRIVRELARACWEPNSQEYNDPRLSNFEMVQVKPNWHDSSELIGYVSRVSSEPVYVAGDFLKFIAKAWEEPDVPYFLCLDEMNLAPVEQYFAEYLSVVESRKTNEDGTITTDAILKLEAQQWYYNLVNELTDTEDVKTRFLSKGISIPQNLIVVGTVNMDETTFSFSRKVLDRAMTIEMNEVNLHAGLEKRYENIGKIGFNELIGSAVEVVDIYNEHKDVCDLVIDYLEKVNAKLEGTPFKIAYRTRNEFLLYVVNNLPYDKNEDGEFCTQEYVIARALDEITSMKILVRIEGDETKVSAQFLSELEQTIKQELAPLYYNDVTVKEFDDTIKSVSLSKLREMKSRLSSGYTSFWS